MPKSPLLKQQFLQTVPPLTRAELDAKIVADDDVSSVNTCQITDMSFMFFGNNTFNQDISGWNTGAVTNMSTMFSGATSFNQDIGSWNTGAVTNMDSMFSNATSFNQDISGWDVANVPIAGRGGFHDGSPLVEAQVPPGFWNVPDF